MAIRLSSHRCIDCSGLLEFNKEEKRFECPYCGKIYEKDFQFDKIQIDGMASTNDIVRATLLNISSGEMNEAKKNLLEAEKINFDYIGTKVAALAYYRFLSFESDESQYNQVVAKMRSYASEIKDVKNVEEVESQLYSFLNQSETYAVLYISFISCGINERADYIANYLEFGKIINPTLNKYMLRITLQYKAFNEADQILNNFDLIDKKYSLFLVLKYYPDGSKKQTHIENLFLHGALSYKDYNIVNKYLDETHDSALTKLVVVVHALELKMQLSITDILSNILIDVSDESVIEKIFTNLKLIKLKDNDTALLVNYLLGSSCHKKTIITNGLKSLKENGSLYEISSIDINRFISESNLDVDDMVDVLDFIYNNFKISNKCQDLILDFVLNKFTNNAKREKIIFITIKNSSSITVKSLTEYAIGQIDGQNKPEIFEKLLTISINKVYFSGLLSKYIISNNDTMEVKWKMMDLISKYDNLIIDEAYKKMLYCIKSEDEFNRLNSFKLNVKSGILEDYLDESKIYVDEIINKFLDQGEYVSPLIIKKYLLSKYTKSKAILGLKMLKNFKEFKDDITYNCKFLSDSISCNFIQYYFFVSKDEFECKIKIMKRLDELKQKLSENMLVNGKKISFKKYIVANRNEIGSCLDKICEELSVYKLFF